MQLRQPPEYFNTQLDKNLNSANLIIAKQLKQFYDSLAWKEDYGSGGNEQRRMIAIFTSSLLYASMIWSGFKPKYRKCIEKCFKCNKVNFPSIISSFEGSNPKFTPTVYSPVFEIPVTNGKLEIDYENRNQLIGA